MGEPSRIFREGLLDGQVCVVSGAGTGLGKATALELGAPGRDRRRLRAPRRSRSRETVADDRGGRGRGRGEPLDIRDEEAVDAFVDEVLDATGASTRWSTTPAASS